MEGFIAEVNQYHKHPCDGIPAQFLFSSHHQENNLALPTLILWLCLQHANHLC